MATNGFLQTLKKSSNSTLIDEELRRLDVSNSNDIITDNLYRQLSKTPLNVRKRLTFFNSIVWHSPPISIFSDARIMFTINDVSSILRNSHRTSQAIKTRLDQIKLSVAKEYPLGSVSVHNSVRPRIVSHIASNLILRFIVYNSDTDAILWFKSAAHGGEYLKVEFNGKTNKTNFNFKD